MSQLPKRTPVKGKNKPAAAALPLAAAQPEPAKGTTAAATKVVAKPTAAVRQPSKTVTAAARPKKAKGASIAAAVHKRTPAATAQKKAAAPPAPLQAERSGKSESDDDVVEGAPLTAEQLKVHAPLVREVQRLLAQQQAQTRSEAAQRKRSTVRTAPATEAPPSPTVTVTRSSRSAKRAHAELELLAAATTADDTAPAPHRRSKRQRTGPTSQRYRGNPADNVSPAELAERGVVYLGHLPHGFFEDQMRAFFSQFGEVTRLRLARNPKSGASRHYGFVEFAHSSVATIVADAMHRYLMFGHTLIAAVVPPEQCHPDLFRAHDRPFRRIPHADNARRAHNRPRSGAEQERRITRLLKRDNARRQRLEALGVAFDFPGYAAELSAQ